MTTGTFRDDRPLFRCWCEAERCDWEQAITGRSPSSTALFGHGLRTGHADTYRESHNQ